MSPLRKDFIDMLTVRRMSKKTIESYVGVVASLAWFHHRSPLELTEEDIRKYFIYKIRERKIQPRTVNLHIAALRTFYRMMSPGNRIMERFRKVRVPRSLPNFLEREDLLRLLDSISNLKHKAAILLMYSSGLRVSECARLRIEDIQSTRMLVRVNQGKGKKDRYTVLAVKALEVLREYYRKYRPKEWLFEGWHDQAITARTLMLCVTRAALKAGIRKHVTAHTLRHSFATHLLENGTTIQTIQEVLGHKHLKTTSGYTHVTRAMMAAVKSPVDMLESEGGHAE